MFETRLFFGGYDGRVYEADVGFSDLGLAIVGDVQTAWNYMGSRGIIKRLCLARPMLTSQTAARISITARMDYQDTPEQQVTTGGVTNALFWGVGSWGVNVWGGEGATTRGWRSISGIGRCVSLLVRAENSTTPFAINTVDLVFEPGEYL